MAREFFKVDHLFQEKEAKASAAHLTANTGRNYEAQPDEAGWVVGYWVNPSYDDEPPETQRPEPLPVRIPPTDGLHDMAARECMNAAAAEMIQRVDQLEKEKASLIDSVIKFGEAVKNRDGLIESYRLHRKASDALIQKLKAEKAELRDALGLLTDPHTDYCGYAYWGMSERGQGDEDQLRADFTKARAVHDKYTKKEDVT